MPVDIGYKIEKIKMPNVTVLMACYNASGYLSEAVKSILAQTYSDYEFIIVNDGSTDSTLDMVKGYAAQDGRIVVISKNNTGLPDSLNKGLGVAKGNWIARLDADDIALPNRLARQIAYVEEYPSTVLVGTGCTLIDVLGQASRNYQYPIRHDLLVRQIRNGGSPFPHSSAFFRRETAIQLGGYNRRFVRSQDVDLWLRLSDVGKIACLPESLVQIRRHDANISDHNSGPTQTIMGMAARVCSFIRSMGKSPPSQDDDVVWNRFIEWLSERLGKESYCETRRQWSNLRQQHLSYVKQGRKLQGAFKLAAKLLFSGCVFQIIHSRILDSRLPLRLAQDWTRIYPN